MGAILTFQCDTGYMPQEEVTSTCLSNSSWVPAPECTGNLDSGDNNIDLLGLNIIKPNHAFPLF